ncbi:MAG: DUF423 domain-containing protein [Verrucomicrobia bacterium]|nr:MAG: DUF423 domain-containing protein [Verrucomicrobiota bacterium]
MSILFFRIAAVLCFLAVALGAFGAHSLRSSLELHGMLDVWNKAVLYHFVHAIALLVLALYGTVNRGAWWLLLAGILLFSGSLYVMALTNLRWLGAITPLGGLCFLAGWAWLIITPPK